MEVAVTGMAIWCSLGRTLKEFETSLRFGRSGLRQVMRFDVSHPFYRTKEAASLTGEDALVPQLDCTKIADLALFVAREALSDAAFGSPPPATRFGMALGTSHGGNIAFMKLIRARMGNDEGPIDHLLALSCSSTILGQVARQVGVGGPTVTISTACASGTNSVGRAAELISLGHADIMLAGGADLFTELSFSGFNMLGVLSPGPCRPLDRDRNGMMLGDGAAMLVLESKNHAIHRKAHVYAEIAGHAISNEAYHPTAPRPGGGDAAKVMAEALRIGGIDRDEVDYINLHGTGTEANDETELMAVAQVFGKRAPKILLSSTKSQVGHTLGAAGSVELVATILGMTHGFAPPTIHLTNPIRGFEDWSYVRNVARPAVLRAALSNSFGFSGCLSSISLRQATSQIRGD